MINPELMPEHITYNAAKYLDDVIQDYFKDPEHQKAFAVWQQNRKERYESKKGTGIIVDCSSLDHNSICLA